MTAVAFAARCSPVKTCVRLPLGMAQLSPQGLSEQWVLRFFGDQHWALIAKALGQRDAVFHAPDGQPVYAAFCATSLHMQAAESLLGRNVEVSSSLCAVSDLPPELRWRQWMRRIEAVLFASASPVPREDLSKIVGQGVSVDLLIEDLAADLEGRAFEIARVSSGWMFRTRAAYAPVIKAAADIGEQVLDLKEFDVAVLAAIAYHQPITRDGLKDIFGKEISRELIGRFNAQGVIRTGPRAPRRGAPLTFVTTEKFLEVFGMQSLNDLPEQEQKEDAGILAQSSMSTT